ncbi:MULTISPECIES: trimeric intracellular cation channel family protein [Clostridium]|uniref:Membrane protein YeiH n=1 Tax=Clostridium beijerinckii TaxID=1520 RepID=A0AAX0AZS3_CLOBE|nr:MULTISPECIES: trimeric intracellular cation channel family protein [Clostridium]MBA8934864.1 putative membrane protein YeiH [Clostridium beijerinckii]MBN7574556.1 trimeric intracellular cation channel family protein [Clostridium beijerinckii]MBN7579519.1 trimeric intracellular cation channel family protein [Clostridium beijerinckii]MBN7584117.1 trimeric intracellular cation channel family protein [Clostridium beijerinckii]MBO0520059.1 trimeric intracellular cation channel family protein [Cl
MNDINILEYLGIFAFAASGAHVAIEEKFDLFGIYILATVTAMGGGVLRDIVTNVGIPLFFENYTTIPFIILGATIPVILRGKLKYNNMFVIIDAIGLSAFSVSSGIKALESGYNLMLFLFATSITGVGGGVLRDIITNRKPEIFKTDVYCIACILGSLLLWFLYPLLGTHLSQHISLIVIFSIRMICYIKKINLPIIDKN